MPDDKDNDKGNDNHNGGQDQPSIVEPTDTINQTGEPSIVEDSHISINAQQHKPGTLKIVQSIPLRDD